MRAPDLMPSDRERLKGTLYVCFPHTEQLFPEHGAALRPARVGRVVESGVVVFLTICGAG